MSKEASGNFEAVFDAWTTCGNCKQHFEDALELEMKRRFWRHHRPCQDLDLRSSQDLVLRYNSTKNLAICLGNNGEIDVANQLVDAEKEWPTARGPGTSASHLA